MWIILVPSLGFIDKVNLKYFSLYIDMAVYNNNKFVLWIDMFYFSTVFGLNIDILLL